MLRLWVEGFSIQVFRISALGFKGLGCRVVGFMGLCCRALG